MNDRSDLESRIAKHLRGAVNEQPIVPIYASAVKVQARRQRRVGWIAGSVAVAAIGSAAVFVGATFLPSLGSIEAVPDPAGGSVMSASPTTDAGPWDTASPTPPVSEPTPEGDSTPAAEVSPTAQPPAVSSDEPPASPAGMPVVTSPVVPDKTWKLHNLSNVGISVELPSNMVAYLDKEFDNGWRLDTKATRSGKEMKEILVWPESLTGGMPENVKDLGIVPDLVDASGNTVHVGLAAHPDEGWDEVLLMVQDSSGAWQNLIDFGQGKFYVGSDDNWDPTSKADRNKIIAILASTRYLTG